MGKRKNTDVADEMMAYRQTVWSRKTKQKLLVRMMSGLSLYSRTYRTVRMLRWLIYV